MNPITCYHDMDGTDGVAQARRAAGQAPSNGAVRAPLRMLQRLELDNRVARRVGDVLEVTCTQRQLAAQLQISHGTLQKYLNALGPAVVSRRPLCFDLTRPLHPCGSLRQSSPTGVLPSRELSDPRLPLVAAAGAYWAAISELASGAAESICATDKLEDSVELAATFEDSLGVWQTTAQSSGRRKSATP